MKLPSTPKQIGLWIAALAVTALGTAWILIPAPNPSRDAQQAQNEWQLPNIYLFENSQQVYNQLQKRQAWGKTEQAKRNAKNKTQLLSKNWRLAGIVQSGQQRFALLQDTKKNKVQRYSVGDTLDNGGQLVKIHADAVEIKLAGDIDTEYLYPRKNAKK
ncbi:type II secretion system protein N [Candidatus Albibeggiatoa sp. nov. BB20]|uniref:type II secretion system protein N n=1 Tax=Candidatus Albibeggiatoa sp. nov. BB20 TaxID=3162723 RepID=UPI00336541AE